MNKLRLDGINVGPVTPFTRDNAVDLEGIIQNLDFLIESGINTIEPVSVNGEGSLLARDEYKKVIQVTVDHVNGRVPVCAGAPGASTDAIIQNLKVAKDAGADGGYLSNPAYLLPTQREMFAHFSKIMASVDFPIVIYNSVHRSGVDLRPETVAKLAFEHSNLAAFKEGSLASILKLKYLLDDKLPIIGEDWLFVPGLAIGVIGVQSVVGHIFPRMVVDMYEDFRRGDFERAKRAQVRLYPLMEVLGIGTGGTESSPGPLKAALKMLGKAGGDPRQPLLPAPEETKRALKILMIELDSSLKDTLK